MAHPEYLRDRNIREEFAKIAFKPITDRMATFPSIEEYVEGLQILYYEESTEAIVSIYQNLNLTSLRINGKTDASSHGDMVTQKLSSHLPALYYPGRPDRCLG